MQVTNVFRERRRRPARYRCRSLCLAFALVCTVGTPAAAERDGLTIGIIQFPSTLNPNIDVMAAKNYVLGAALRPFTVYDAEWKLVCLLCVSLPSIEGGGAAPGDFPDGKKGIDMTFTIRLDARWGDGVRVP